MVLADLRMAALTPDPAMAGTLAAYDLALLDVSELACSQIVPHGLYVVERGNEALVRHIPYYDGSYYLAADTALDHPAAREPWNPGTTRSDAVRGRVIWLGREEDRGQFQRGLLLYDPISS